MICECNQIGAWPAYQNEFYSIFPAWNLLPLPLHHQLIALTPPHSLPGPCPSSSPTPRLLSGPYESKPELPHVDGVGGSGRPGAPQLHQGPEQQRRARPHPPGPQEPPGRLPRRSPRPPPGRPLRCSPKGAPGCPPGHPPGFPPRRPPGHCTQHPLRGSSMTSATRFGLFHPQPRKCKHFFKLSWSLQQRDYLNAPLLSRHCCVCIYILYIYFLAESSFIMTSVFVPLLTIASTFTILCSSRCTWTP